MTQRSLQSFRNVHFLVWNTGERLGLPVIWEIFFVREEERRKKKIPDISMGIV